LQFTFHLNLHLEITALNKETQDGWTISYWSLLISTGPLHPWKWASKSFRGPTR
jgi:hypothetical protein